MCIMGCVRYRTGFAFAALLAIVLAGCSNQKDSAQNLLWEIDATISAAEPEAVKYVPEQLADIRAKVGDLRTAFDKKDYAGVISLGPAVLSSAQSLATAAAARKDEILKAQNDDWSSLAAAVPDEVTALQNRVELLDKKSAKKLAKGVDVESAKDRMVEVTSLWSKAQAAYAAGNLKEAVATAKDVKSRADALAVALKMDL
jgi:PBP1b-binding outer membrane lipoprotein LpoB